MTGGGRRCGRPLRSRGTLSDEWSVLTNVRLVLDTRFPPSLKWQVQRPELRQPPGEHEGTAKRRGAPGPPAEPCHEHLGRSLCGFPAGAPRNSCLHPGAALTGPPPDASAQNGPEDAAVR